MVWPEELLKWNKEPIFSTVISGRAEKLEYPSICQMICWRRSGLRGFEQFSGTNRWIARTDDMTHLGIPLDSAQNYKLDPRRRMTGSSLACFKLPTQIQHYPHTLLEASQPCQVESTIQTTGTQTVAVQGEGSHTPSIPVTARLAVERLVGSEGQWRYNAEEALFLFVKQDVICGAVRECASQENLDCKQQTVSEAYREGSEIVLNNPVERSHGKAGVITKVDDEMTGVLAVHAVRVQTSKVTHKNVMVPVKQMIPADSGFKPGQRVMTPDGPAIFLGMDIGNDEDDHQLSYRVALENQLTKTGKEYALAGLDIESYSLYRQGELFTTE